MDICKKDEPELKTIDHYTRLGVIFIKIKMK